MYSREGNLWGYGDGKLLLPLQKLINELYDKIRIASRPNLLLFDINSELSLDDFDVADAFGIAHYSNTVLTER